MAALLLKKPPEGGGVPLSGGVPRLGGEVPPRGGVPRLGGEVPHNGGVPRLGGGVLHSGSVPLGGGVSHCCSVPLRGGVPHGGRVPLGGGVPRSGGVPSGEGSGPWGTRVSLYKGPEPSLTCSLILVSLSLPRGGVLPCNSGGVLPGGLVPRSSGGTPCIGSDVPQGGVVVVGIGHVVVESMYVLYARESMYVLLARVVVESMYALLGLVVVAPRMHVSLARVVFESMDVLLGLAVVESMYMRARGKWMMRSAMPFVLFVGSSRSCVGSICFSCVVIARGRRGDACRARTCRARGPEGPRASTTRAWLLGPVTC